MAKYLVLYRSSISAAEQMANTTPEQAQAGMEAWMTWAAKAGDAIIDLGAPLSPVANLGEGAGSGSDVAGFSILQGESTEAITAVLDGHPHLGWGGTIDVLEFLPIPGMG